MDVARLALAVVCATSCAVSIAADGQAAGARSSAQPSVREDFQYRADVEELREQMNRFGDYPGDQTVARIVARAAQKPDDPEALFWAARCAILGWGAAHNLNGVDLLRKAAALHYLPAVRDLGYAMCVGMDGFVKDQTEGVRLIQEAAGTGDARASAMLSIAHLEGWGPLKKNLDAAIECASRSFKAGYYPAAYNLGRFYLGAGNQEAAERYFTNAAMLGDVNAMRWLVDPSRGADAAKVRQYLVRGVYWRDPQLTRMLAADLLLGRIGLEVDEPLAYRLLVLACDDGDIAAMSLLARARLRGLWSARAEPERGCRELEYLAGGADRTGLAAFLLGQALYDGDGLVRDSHRGEILIRQAAAAGFAPAKNWLTAQTPHQAPKVPLGATTLPVASAAEGRASTLQFAPAIAEAATQLMIPVQQRICQLSAVDQELEDNATMSDWWIVNLYPPPQSVVARVLARARRKPTDPLSLTWASIAVLLHVSNGASAEEAKTWLKQAADAGQPLAMANYGQQVLNGDGFPQNTQQGVDLLTRARDKGEPSAWLYFGAACLDGKLALPQDYGQGIAVLRRAMDDNPSYTAVLLPLAEGYYGHKDWVHLAEVVNSGCARTYGPCYTLAIRLYSGQLPAGDGSHTVQLANAWNELFVRGTLAGNRAATTEFASHEINDPDGSRLLLRRAAMDGSIEARAILAAALVCGDFGIRSDSERGLAQLEELVSERAPASHEMMQEMEWNVGHAKAEWLLGKLMIDGKCAQRDPSRARQLIESAASEHDPDAGKWLATHR